MRYGGNMTSKKKNPSRTKAKSVKEKAKSFYDQLIKNAKHITVSPKEAFPFQNPEMDLTKDIYVDNTSSAKLVKAVLEFYPFEQLKKEPDPVDPEYPIELLLVNPAKEPMPKFAGARERTKLEVFFDFSDTEFGQSHTMKTSDADCDKFTIFDNWTTQVPGDIVVDWSSCAVLTIKKWRIDFWCDSKTGIRRLFQGLRIIPIIGNKSFPEMVMCNQLLEPANETGAQKLSNSADQQSKSNLISSPSWPTAQEKEIETRIGAVRKIFLGSDEPSNIDNQNGADLEVNGAPETIFHGFVYNNSEIRIMPRQSYWCKVEYKGKPVQGVEFLRVVGISEMIKEIK